MKFISYAQNFEDVMLFRALKKITHGFYVDVGAAWPTEHSVTKAFYDRGWHGINIEPNPKLCVQLNIYRCRDINLSSAIHAEESKLIMDFLDDSGSPTGLSTLSHAIAEQHKQKGFHVESQEVLATTLKSIWKKYIPIEQDVHFLKIDVEGMEDIVLYSNDWVKNRPWIVVVESTFPSSKAESYLEWEPTLVAAHYHFVYADGLNRFYLAEEKMTELQPAFKYPPNVFDEFILYAQEQAENKKKQAEAKLFHTERSVLHLQSTINSIYASHSWRITAPLRYVVKQFKILPRVGLLHFKKQMRIYLVSSIQYMCRYAWLKKIVLAVLNPLPGLRKHVLHFITNNRFAMLQESPLKLENLTPYAQHIYFKLCASIERRRKMECIIE